MTKRDWGRSQVIAESALGGNPLRVLLKDQRNALADDVRTIKKKMPRVVNAQINTSVLKNFKGDKEQLIRTKMGFSTQAVFSAAAIEEIDLVTEARKIMLLLMTASSPTFLYRYRTTFAYIIGGKIFRSLPNEVDAAIIGIINTHSYSPKVECRNWPRPFRQVWQRINRKANQAKMDLRIRNLQGVTEVNEGRPWPSPVIEVGYLNTMRGKTGNYLGRQRCRPHPVFDIH